MTYRVWKAVMLFAMLLVAACSSASSDPQPSIPEATQTEMVVYRSPT